MPTAYQLALTTPGIFPSRASLRKQQRHISNLRMYPWGRPQIGQRLYFLTLNFGSCLALFTILLRAISFSFLTGEGHAQLLQERLGFFIGLCGCYEGDIHAALTNDLVVVDLREEKLLFEAEVKIAPAVEALL